MEKTQHLCPVTYKTSPHSNKIRVQVDFGDYVMTGMPGGNIDRISQREHYINFGVRVQGRNHDNDFGRNRHSQPKRRTRYERNHHPNRTQCFRARI